MIDSDNGTIGQERVGEAPDHDRHDLALDLYFETGAWPDPPSLETLAGTAIEAALSASGADIPDAAELSIVFTNDAAIKALNAKWRDKDTATNVLSFPQDGGPLLGDIVLAFETVDTEARLANKPVDHHIAHLLIHGFLHILGYSHDDEAAGTMEAIERAALSEIDIPDPYTARRPAP
ncbi:MAG: rRNA maturation RNase YbeY [Alphaproteobacteria bacterium]